MNYLQTTVFNALQKNPNVADEAKGYALQTKDYIDLLRLDAGNRQLVAEELGATEEQMSGLLTIVKAVWNEGQCEEIQAVGSFMSEEARAFEERMQRGRIISEKLKN